MPNNLRPGWVKDTTFDANVYNEMLLNVAWCQGYSFNRFWVIKGKQTESKEGEKVKLDLKSAPSICMSLLAAVRNSIYMLKTIKKAF